MSAHTVGPWTLNLTKVDGAVVRVHVAGPVHGSSYPICEHVIEDQPDGSEQLANARLIAAAPELAKALRDLITAMDERDYRLMETTPARAVLAKIDGVA